MRRYHVVMHGLHSQKVGAETHGECVEVSGPSTGKAISTVAYQSGKL